MLYTRLIKFAIPVLVMVIYMESCRKSDSVPDALYPRIYNYDRFEGDEFRLWVNKAAVLPNPYTPDEIFTELGNAFIPGTISIINFNTLVMLGNGVNDTLLYRLTGDTVQIFHHTYNAYMPLVIFKGSELQMLIGNMMTRTSDTRLETINYPLHFTVNDGLAEMEYESLQDMQESDTIAIFNRTVYYK